MELVERYRKGNLVLSIYLDPDPENPRDWDNLGTMVCRHRRYVLGDEQAEISPPDLPEGSVVLPIYLMDHSGLSVFSSDDFGCPWDSDLVGYIYVTPEKMDKEGVTKESAIRILKSEVDAYNDFLCGHVYGYVLEREETCEHCDHTHKVHEDSCWGFFGMDLEMSGIYEHAVPDFDTWEKER